MQIEIIVTNKQEAIFAKQNGANRLELIHKFELGGLSPSLQTSKEICDSVDIPVNIMLRPHGNNFQYSIKDIKNILFELEYIRDNTRANGIVFGALNNDNRLDLNLLEYIIKNKGHLQLTFHRAIDVSNDIIVNYNELLNYPEVDFVLTSGGKETALEGLENIKKMVGLNKKNGGSNAQVIAGSGINTDNVKGIIAKSHVNQIHLGSGVRNSLNNELSAEKFIKLNSIINGID